MNKQEIKELIFTQVEAWDNVEKIGTGELQGYDCKADKFLVDRLWFDHIRQIKPKKRIQMNAETCPRRPVLKNKGWGEYEERYPHIGEKGLIYSGLCITWESLADEDQDWILGDGSPWTVEVDA